MLYVRRTLGRDRGNTIQFEATDTYETDRERPSTYYHVNCKYEYKTFYVEVQMGTEIEFLYVSLQSCCHQQQIEIIVVTPQKEMPEINLETFKFVKNYTQVSDCYSDDIMIKIQAVWSQRFFFVKNVCNI